MTNEPILKITIDNKSELELFEFTSSMAALNEDYCRYVATKGANFRSNCRLCINKIVPGSIIVELIEKAPAVLPGVAPIISDYTIHLTNTLEYLAGRTKALPPFKFTRENFLNIKKLVELAAACTGNAININLTFNHVVINNTYSTTDANAIQNKCEKEIKRLDQAGESLIKEKVSLKLYQARDSVLSKTTKGNLGIIDEVSDQPKPISFSNDRLRYDITKAESNPLNFIYIVDIEVKLKEGSLFLETPKDIKEYEILKLYGPIENVDLFSDETS